MSFHIVFPAAGIGRRFGLNIPKQYCEINNQTVMSITLSLFQSLPEIRTQVVALASDDKNGQAVLNEYPNIQITTGGNERSDSVVNALRFLASTESEDDWVLVHDIARPCVGLSDVWRLMNHCLKAGNGAVLGHKVTDTVKSWVSGEPVKTIDRSSLWVVQTPQCFRLGQLLNALEFCIEQRLPVTDEASAMEFKGYSVDIVEGHKSNIKLTHADDQALIEFYLKQQGRL